MAKYKAYPEYKDSGVEWLGEIPSSWDMWKLSHAYEAIGSGTTPTSSNEFWFQGDIPWVTTGELRETVINDTFKKISLLTLQTFSALKIHPAGSIVIAMYGATIGRLGILGIDATTNQACCVMTKSNIVNNQYLYYWLQAFKEDIIRLSSGGGQPNINQEKVASLKVSSPAWNDQAIIVSFLEHETAKIDNLIEKQQQLIELLKEKRQAVISHAVTKGLNPDVPMKDSGVEWLGEVPGHWDVKKLKHIASIIDCKNRTPEYFDDGEYLVVRTTNVKKHSLILDGALYTNERDYKIWTDRGVPPAGSILFTREAPTGEVCIVPEFIKLCMGQRMMNFICHDAEYTKFLFDYLTSNCLKRYIDSEAAGSTVSHLRVEQVYNIPIVIPPYVEQKQIDDIVGNIKSQYSKLISNAEHSLLLLQERRTALISAAVTGKIDVRDWVAPDTSDIEESEEATA